MYADYDGDINIGPPNSVVPALRSKYTRNFDDHFQAMSSKIPIVAIWDDHDYGQDNSDSTYRYKEEAKKVFKESYLKKIFLSILFRLKMKAFIISLKLQMLMYLFLTHVGTDHQWMKLTMKIKLCLAKSSFRGY